MRRRQICLVGGSTDREGNLLLGNRPICDDLWSLEDATVACRQLGFPGVRISQILLYAAIILSWIFVTFNFHLKSTNKIDSIDPSDIWHLTSFKSNWLSPIRQSERPLSLLSGRCTPPTTPWTGWPLSSLAIRSGFKILMLSDLLKSPHQVRCYGNETDLTDCYHMSRCFDDVPNARL